MSNSTLDRIEEHAPLFRHLVNSVQDFAIFVLHPDGRIATWNAGAERIKGYSAAELVGRHISLFYREEDVASRKPARLLAAAAEHGRTAPSAPCAAAGGWSGTSRDAFCGWWAPAWTSPS